MRDHEDDADRGQELALLRERIADTRRKHDEAEAQLIWDQAVRELTHHHAWAQLQDRLTGYRLKAVDWLAARRVDQYELGHVQGRLSMLRIVMQKEPLPLEQIDRIKRYQDELVAQLEEQLEDERNLMRIR